MSGILDRPAPGAAAPTGGGVLLTDIAADARRSPYFDDHVGVFEAREPVSGLHAVIALHNLDRGQALGGARMWRYAAFSDALDDALRLSRGMSFKAAAADLPLGGGKAVILCDPARDKTEALLEAFGAAVERLDGRYVTAEDVGITQPDLEPIARTTSHLVGRAVESSEYTAYGVLVGIEAAVRRRLGGASLSGLTVAVQGLGKVGGALCGLLHERGARLIVSDLDAGRVRNVAERFGAAAAAPEAILEAEADVLAPSALGAVIDDESLPRLRCAVVAGSANNQLLQPRHGEALHRRNILYAPDYVINAGGLIACASELAPAGFEPARARSAVAAIGGRLDEIFARAEREGRSPSVVADALAAERLSAAAPLTA